MDTKGGVNMVKMTSAYANKLLKQLNDDKEFWTNKERKSYMYTAAVGETPVIAAIFSLHRCKSSTICSVLRVEKWA